MKFAHTSAPRAHSIGRPARQAGQSGASAEYGTPERERERLSRRLLAAGLSVRRGSRGRGETVVWRELQEEKMNDMLHLMQI